MRRFVLAPALLVVAVLASASPALAVPECSETPTATVVASGQGRLESVISDDRGRLFFTDLN